MSKKVEVISTEQGQRVFGDEITDTLGNFVMVHESSVPEDEGGPYLWLTLRKSGETGGYGVHLNEEQVQGLLERINLASSELWGR